jgi:hypothetical protein
VIIFNTSCLVTENQFKTLHRTRSLYLVRRKSKWLTKFEVMKEMAFKNLAEQYKFENGVAGVKTVAFGNFFLLVMILTATGESVGFMTHGFFSLIAGSVIFLGTLTYNWANPKVNLIFLFVYMIILFAELLIFGIPEPLLVTSRGLSKGFFFDMVLYMIPFIYIGVRITCILPLVIIYYQSRKLNLEVV